MQMTSRSRLELLLVPVLYNAKVRTSPLDMLFIASWFFFSLELRIRDVVPFRHKQVRAESASSSLWILKVL